MSDHRKGIMRCLGEFVGHIAKGVMSDPTAGRGHRQVVHERTEQRETTSADGQRVILRRTVIDEIETLEEPLHNTAREDEHRP